MTHTLPGLRRLLPFVAAIVLLVAGHLTAAQSVVTFSVSGARATVPLAVNNRGVVAGLYLSDADVNPGAFVRDARGAISTLQVADATGFHQYMGLNISGTLVGTYLSSTVLARGFVRTPDGDITPFDIPGAGITLLTNINDRGAMIGVYLDSTFSHGAGFVVSPDGEVEELVGPGDFLYIPFLINTTGAISGIIQGFDGGYYGAFHRDAHGHIGIIDIPLVPSDPAVTDVEIVSVQPTGINAAGTVTGQYSVIEWADNEQAGPGAKKQIGTGSRGFLRHPDGVVETFDFPGALSVDQGRYSYTSTVNGLTAAGAVVGYRSEPGFGVISYLQSRNGRSTTVAVDGAWATGVRDTSPSGLMVGTVLFPDYFETGQSFGFIMR